MSYFFEKNLKKDGSYYDKYFSINTKSLKKTLWILIPITKNNNDSIDGNLYVICQEIFVIQSGNFDGLINYTLN